MSTDLYNRVNYHSEIDYYSGYIIEYDLSKANINALFTREMIDPNLYTFLYTADKKYREIIIGNMIKENPNIYKEIQAGIIDAKKQFVEANNIEDHEILSIRNDAFYLLTDRPMEQKFGFYNFAKKSVFTFYFKFFQDNDFFYRYDLHAGTDIVEVKGISDENLALHQDYFLKFIVDTLYSIERSNIEDVLNDCNAFYTAYLNKELDIGYYREFNNNSSFRVTTKNKSYLIPNLDEANKLYININYNLRILRDLIKVVDSIYFQRKN